MMQCFKSLLTAILLVISSVSFASCDRLKYGDLFSVTDSFVEELDTRVQSYGFQGDVRDAQDGVYRVVPIGRLVMVKIVKLSVASSSDYEQLRKVLQNHYSGDRRVNDVFINGYGVVSIDCRN